MSWYHIVTVNLQPLATIDLRSSIIDYLSPSVTHGWVCSFVLIIGGLLCNDPPRNLQFIRSLANRVGRWIHMINAIRLHWYRKTLTISAQSSPIPSVLLLDTVFVEINMTSQGRIQTFWKGGCCYLWIHLHVLDSESLTRTE